MWALDLARLLQPAAQRLGGYASARLVVDPGLPSPAVGLVRGDLPVDGRLTAAPHLLVLAATDEPDRTAAGATGWLVHPTRPAGTVWLVAEDAVVALRHGQRPRRSTGPAFPLRIPRDAGPHLCVGDVLGGRPGALR